MRISYTAKLLSIAFFLFFANVNTAKLQAQEVVTTITYQHFYDGLSPYGIWIDYPGYGHVWHPSVDGNFRPYFTNGYWDYCHDGWIWVSYYDWGWAPFHYGRWLYDDLYGWLWIPGYEWSPAWVIWGDYDAYYAWAPLMPSVNVTIWFGHWRPTRIYWNVVERIYIYDRDISKRGRSNLGESFFRRIRINNNYSRTSYYNHYYARGPEVKEVEKYVNRQIVPVSIRDTKATAPAARVKDELRIYRPRIKTDEPRTYRSIERINPKPIRFKTDKPKTDRSQQLRNLERLPIRKSPTNEVRKKTTRSTKRNNNH